MSNEIVNNLTRNNHFSRVLASFEKAIEITVVSPFISKNISFFPFDKLTKLKKITLVTTLKPRDSEQYTKVPFFKSLFTFCNEKNIDLKILIENSLHGKVYISKFEDDGLEAIITSANFTTNGLRVNNEWGTVITNHEKITELRSGILSKVVLQSLSEKDVNEFSNIIKQTPPVTNKSNQTDLDLSNQIGLKPNPYSILNNITYWLKPIGVSTERIPWDKVYDERDSNMYFSVRPTGIRKNDILICYAVGHSNILSIYKVISEMMSTGNEEHRWPYFVLSENLTPYYGQNWNTQNITITNQRKEVLDKKLFNITPSGKNSYGKLMQGGDKLRLTPEYGAYLVNKIAKIDNEIKTQTSYSE